MFSRVERIERKLVCDEQTDRQTDTIAHTALA